MGSSVSFIVYGQCYSMKNSKIPNGRAGIKHPKARAFAELFGWQVPPSAKLGLGSKTQLLRATISVWYPTWKQDVSLDLVYDLLEATGVVSNDRWIREKFEYGAHIDPRRPRVEITVEEI